jgi:hypothetical protein
MVLDAIKEVSNATETGRNKVLPTMPEATDTEKVQQGTGGQWGIPSAEVLQSDLHGKVSDKGNSPKISITQESQQVKEKTMREVRDNSTIEYPSYQRGRIGQLPGKLNDALRSMSHEVALGTRQGNKPTPAEYVLQDLWTACKEIGHVPDALSKIPQIWESFNDEEKDWIVIRCYSGNPWHSEWPGIPRVATGIKNRVNRLKGLGNAVVPQQIYLVYKAIIDYENNPGKPLDK